MSYHKTQTKGFESHEYYKTIQFIKQKGKEPNGTLPFLYEFQNILMGKEITLQHRDPWDTS